MSKNQLSKTPTVIARLKNGWIAARLRTAQARLAPPRISGLAAVGAMALFEVAGCGNFLLWPRVVLFGDSITQFSFQPGGWGASLADKLVRKCDVLNRGFSGYNTRWAKIILPRLIRKGSILDNPVAITIFFGANDSALKEENPKQHVPLDEYVANLKSMVQHLRSVGVPEDRVILITPPPLCEAAWEKECVVQGCKLNRLNSVVGEYASACLHVARDCRTDVLDLWTLMQTDGQGHPGKPGLQSEPTQLGRNHGPASVGLSDPHDEHRSLRTMTCSLEVGLTARGDRNNWVSAKPPAPMQIAVNWQCPQDSFRSARTSLCLCLGRGIRIN